MTTPSESLTKYKVLVRAVTHLGMQWLVPDSDLIGFNPEVPSGSIHYDSRITRYTALTEGTPIPSAAAQKLVAEFNRAHPNEPYEYELAKPTKVIFRVWRDVDQAVIAIFPEEPSDTQSWYNCDMYERIGGHGGGNPAGVIRQTRPAQPEEYAALKRELESYPYFYQLAVYKRISCEMTAERERRWRE